MANIRNIQMRTWKYIMIFNIPKLLNYKVRNRDSKLKLLILNAMLMIMTLKYF